MFRRFKTGVAGLAVLAALGSLPVASQTGGSSTASELIERERIRREVEAAFDLYRKPAIGDYKNENIVLAADRLVALGDAAALYVIDELRQTHPATFTFCAYVLGRLGHPDGVAPLREAIADADGERGQFALARKAWAAYGLALMGIADSVDLLNDGKRISGGVPIHFQMSMIELAAVLTTPDSIPLLYSQLKRYAAGDEEHSVARRFTFKAMRLAPGPGHVKAVQEVMEKGAGRAIRRNAAESLERVETPESVATLISILQNDDDPHTRYAAMWSLDRLQPKGQLKTLAEHLDNEPSPHVRGLIYRTLARRGGRDQLKRLMDRWGHWDPVDREYLLEALSIIGDSDGLEIFEAALIDDDTKVAARAAALLPTIKGKKAERILLDEVSSARWPVAQTALLHLVRNRQPGTAEAIIQRVLTFDMKGVVTDPRDRDRVYRLLDALLDLGASEALDRLDETIKRQREGGLVVYLREWTAKMKAVKSAGADTDGWIAHVDSDEAGIRALAYQFLGRIGGEKAAAALAARFDQVETTEQVEILRALGEIDAESAKTLVERVLLDELFDDFDHSTLRAMAAWSARRLGGARMIDALKASADRRSGRDAHTLFYLLVLAGKDAIPVVERWRLPRMHFLKWSRGIELEYLDLALRGLRHGRPIDLLDQPPKRINLLTRP